MLNLRGNSSPNKKAEALIRGFGLCFFAASKRSLSILN